MSLRARFVRIFWKWVAPLAGLAALALAVFVYFHSPRERTYRFRLTAGNATGTRHHLARLLQAELAPHNLLLELEETPGSEEALDEVNSRQLDLALVQGGLKVNGRPNVRQVIGLHVEPLHLLVKKELFGLVSANLSTLDGKTVDLSEVGSGTHSLATDVLAFAGLRPRRPGRPGGYVVVEWDRRRLLAEKDPARLPDAVFLVSSLPSSTSRFLVTRHGYRLVPLPFAEAFALDARAPPGPGQPGRPPGQHVDKERTYAVAIPAFTYGVEPPVPPEPVPTLGARLLLVAHKDVSPQAVRTLVEAVLASQLARTNRPPIDAKALELPPEYPWHAGARLYQKRNTPLVSGTLVDATQKGFAILAAAASGLFVLWQWSKQSRQLKKDRGFHDYISQVTRIEEQTGQVERGRSGALSQFLALQERLGCLKVEALDRFAEGELAGKELLSAFLIQVNHTRDYLARLVAEQQVRPQEPAGKEVSV
jgi:TRAP-type uncharacterized transport system substrate-binding protein